MSLVVQEFQTGQFTQAELARRHGVSPATVCNWVRTVPRQPGKRGRKEHTAPTLEQQEMLLEAWKETYQAAATRHDVSKQYMHHLATRWKGWAEQAFGPRCIKPRPIDTNLAAVEHVACMLSPKVISFRIPDSVLAKITSLRAHKTQFRNESLHFVARELLMAGLDQGYALGSSSDEPVQIEAVCVTR